MVNNSVPMASIVIVNYNGKVFLERCLNSVLQQDCKNYEVLLVDNASSDGSADFVAERFPWVKLIKSTKNNGFTGGNNLGIALAASDYIVLLNNDTTVETTWLSSLIKLADSDKAIGAVGSKIVFYKKFLPVVFSTESFIPRNRGVSPDTRPLGFRLKGQPEFTGTDYSKIFFEAGFYGIEWDSLNQCDFQWTSGLARVYVPYNEGQNEYFLSMNAAGEYSGENKIVYVSIGDTLIGSITTGDKFCEFKLMIDKNIITKYGVDILNNAGSYRKFGGIAGDIGFGEVDRQQFDQQRELNNLCGGSVLLKRDMLSKIGTFDERLFMYYEDVDLFWRAQKQGWKLLYCPVSVVTLKPGNSCPGFGISRIGVLRSGSELVFLVYPVSL